MAAPEEPVSPERLARLEAIVLRMPRRTREIFIAHRVHDMSYAEIARRTGLTVRQVQRHMVRAILHLDRGLNREERPWWKFW
jgi:RNA polymerase sigma-70 factor (ECF subfamily)